MAQLPRLYSFWLVFGLVGAHMHGCTGTASAQDAPAPLRPQTPGGPPFGIGGTSDRPGLALLPQDNDWSFLANPDRRTEPMDVLRYMPLDADEDFVLSLSAYLYAEIESFDDANWGVVPGNDTYVNTRANVIAALSWRDRVRVLAGIKHGGRFGERDNSAPPSESNDIDLHNTLVEVAAGDALGGAKKDLLLRTGRMELHYGDGQLISIRQGPNARRDFDAVQARYRRGATIIDAFAAYEVEDTFGAFDDDTDTDRGTWGVYATTPANVLPGSFDFFYIGKRDLASPTAFGTFDEKRHTVGVRYWTGPQGVDAAGRLTLDVEFDYQFGPATPVLDFAGPLDDVDIDAWALAGRARYGLGGDWDWGVNLAAGATSGDSDPTDDTVGTFKAPFPPGKYFGETNPLGPGNLTGGSVSVDMAPTDRLNLSAAALAFWRIEDTDGIYTPGSTLLRPAAGPSNFIGHEFNVTAAYALSPAWTLSGEAAYFDVSGDFLENNLPAEDIGRIKAVIAYQF